ncbi:MAG: hypothetical protein JRJ64_11930, partial [Deltaproteobacteria bacterium]|nr:hypothetical protein [Deltaproteobacteria bacterium]
MRRIGRQRLVEDRVGFLDGRVTPVLPHQRSGAGQQRRLEPRIGGITSLFDEAASELRPFFLDLLNLVDRLRDFGIIGFASTEPVVGDQSALVVHQLVAPDTPQLLDEDLPKLRVVA